MNENAQAIKEINRLFLIGLRDEALRDPKVASFIYQVPTEACRALAKLSGSQVLELAEHLEELMPKCRDVPNKFLPLICHELRYEKDFDRLAMKLTILLSN